MLCNSEPHRSRLLSPAYAYGGVASGTAVYQPRTSLNAGPATSVATSGSSERSRLAATPRELFNEFSVEPTARENGTIGLFSHDYEPVDSI